MIIKFSFEQARAIAQRLGFRTTTEWFDYTLSPDFPSQMPINPASYYGLGAGTPWQGWCDFLGMTAPVAKAKAPAKPRNEGSNGEKDIEGFLRARSIKYQRQVRISACRNQRSLPFDFGIPDSTGTFQLLIEFQGEHHTKPIRAFGGPDKFTQIVNNDRIKRDFCANSGIPLLVIPHTDQPRMNLVLDRALREHNIMTSTHCDGQAKEQP